MQDNHEQDQERSEEQAQEQSQEQSQEQANEVSESQSQETETLDTTAQDEALDTSGEAEVATVSDEQVDTSQEVSDLTAADQSGEEQVEAAEDETEAEIEARPEVEIPNLKQILEGAILAADKALSVDNMLSLFDEDMAPKRARVKEALAEIQEDFADRGFELKQIASGYRFQVRQDYSPWVGRLWDERPPKYTRAFLETLSLIAYKQPITRGDIEEIRGVSVSTNIMRSLLEREWIRIVGHRDVPGRPAIYATTKEFLDYFNLASLDELPTLSEIKDLDDVNEKLDLSNEELIEPRTLEIETNEEEAEALEAEEASLDEVTEQVNQIQENIKNVFKEPEEDDLLDEDDEPEAEITDSGEGDSLEPVNSPEPKNSSEQTDSLEPVNSLEPLNSPEQTDSPEPLNSPEPSDSPEQIDSPELVNSPELTGNPDPANSPESDQNPESDDTIDPPQDPETR